MLKCFEGSIVLMGFKSYEGFVRYLSGGIGRVMGV